MKIVGVFCFLVLLALTEAQTKASNTKADTPKGDTPKGDTPKGDTPKGDTPKGDTPKGDTPKADTPQIEKERIVEDIKQLAELVAGEYQLDQEPPLPEIADTMIFRPYKFKRIAIHREDRQGFILEELLKGVHIRRVYLRLITQKEKKSFKVEYYDFNPKWHNRKDDPFSVDTLINHLELRYMSLRSCVYQEIEKNDTMFVGKSYYCTEGPYNMTLTCNAMTFQITKDVTLNYIMKKRDTLPLERRSTACGCPKSSSPF
ncbi:uncharacterized protein LOC106078992 isoform X3 [Biomphalaria glabrata]|uniref:Uncharacterized protein LOC106078992 isoform X3 n=1 Tax=Biomphalaria glabrata TaxID=6526 RepID=A0A9W2Z547_BIOGL|nr:uncharacterized protein LOC106078992 isoform X3 [Biomphalaria glabrata]